MKKGFTLVEVLVSILIFTLVIIAAYRIYDHSQKTYLLGEQLTDTQQATRFAFEKLSHDLRVAGFRVHPDSDALRPDLSVEGMWDGAVAIRADYDQSEEAALECTKNDVTGLCVDGTGQYGLVMTGNRDVRVYVLAKKAGVSEDGSNETLKFKADFSAPRDGVVGNPGTLETVTLNGVSLAQDKPPYKLYQVTFRNPGDDGYEAVPSGGDVPAANQVWTPVADGIFSMRFEYYNQNGIAAANLMDFDDPDASEPDDWNVFRREHGWPFGMGGGNMVKNMVVRLIGMTGRPDGRYTDPVLSAPDFSTAYTAEEQAAYIATKMYRKYELSSTLNLLNVGVAPHELADTVPPDDPLMLEAVTGYCGGALFVWQPSRAEDLAVYYLQVVDPAIWATWGNTFKYNCDDAPDTCTPVSNVEHYANTVGYYRPNLANGSLYRARVFAQDSAGNFSRNPTNEVEFTVDPGPLKPLGAVVSDGAAVDLDGLQRLEVAFIPPVEYDQTQNPACIGEVSAKDGRWPAIRDLYGYRLYHRRQTSATPVEFTPVVEDLVATETTPADDPLKIPRVRYPDLRACPCEYYAYKMSSVTQCQDIDDDHTQTPPCLHTGEVSNISSDLDGNPTAYQAPALQAADVFPQVVPAQPDKPGGAASDLNDGTFEVTLQVMPVLASAFKASDGAFSPNPDPTAQFEVWRYRIYEYIEDPAGNPDADATLIDDPNFGGDDFEDWDAAVDGGAVFLGTTTPMHFTFIRPIPSGESRFYTVAGIYRCDDGGTVFEGQESLAAQVPCATSWGAAITSPAVNYTLVNTGGSIFPVTAAVWDLPAGVTIVDMKITISNTTIIKEPLAWTCVASECTAAYDWNITGLPDGNYTILVQIIDSTGCSRTVTRIATIQAICGNFQIHTLAPVAHQLTWEVVKVNGIEVYFLDKIGFSSQTYQATSLNFYEHDPTAGSPPVFPLWSGGPEDPNGRSVGASFTSPSYVYQNPNFCAGTPQGTLNLNPRPGGPVGASNWFRFSFDQNLTTAAGPLNLLGTLHLRPCDGPAVTSGSVPPRGEKIFFLPAPVCAWEWSYTGREPTVTSVDLCNGRIAFLGANQGANVTIKYWSPSGSIVCPNMPILMGP